MKILFFGTPQIAVPFLQWLTEHEDVIGVVCKPDEPAGRGYELKVPPTKVFAQSKNIPVFQPSGAWPLLPPADVGIAVAYGRIMPKTVYAAPRLGSLNIHFSLLPKYRGAAPMQWALINGEQETGVTAFWLDDGMDTGAVAKQKKIAIEPSDNAITLREKLVSLGLTVLEETMEDLKKNNIVKEPQQGPPSLAPLLKKETGRIDWAKPAAAIANLVRGVMEWPGAYTNVHQKLLKILKVHVDTVKCAAANPGEILEADPKKGVAVQTGAGRLYLLDVQPEGKKPMPSWAFWQGAHLKVGDRLG